MPRPSTSITASDAFSLLSLAIELHAMTVRDGIRFDDKVACELGEEVDPLFKRVIAPFKGIDLTDPRTSPTLVLLPVSLFSDLRAMTGKVQEMMLLHAENVADPDSAHTSLPEKQLARYPHVYPPEEAMAYTSFYKEKLDQLEEIEARSKRPVGFKQLEGIADALGVIIAESLPEASLKAIEAYPGMKAQLYRHQMAAENAQKLIAEDIVLRLRRKPCVVSRTLIDQLDGAMDRLLRLIEDKKRLCARTGSLLEADSHEDIMPPYEDVWRRANALVQEFDEGLNKMEASLGRQLIGRR